MAKQTENNVGIYLRLSQEDMREGDSLSIDNQKLILTKFVTEKGWNLVSEYIDDGYTGTDFERPGVQKLLADAQSGKINTIVVKDLSRFGRNYIEVGRYIDYIFPMNNIRFIAISDNVDTSDRNSAALEMMPIVNLFNEWHSSSTSKKIRAVYEANAKAGNYMGPLAPYGYERNNDANHTLIINPETAPVVERIFEMRSRGCTYRKISDTLNSEGVLTPTDYRYQKSGKENIRNNAHVWNSENVKSLVHNQAYLGRLVQLRTTTVSHKNHKVIHRDSSEWAIVNNAHEPIISQEIWDKCLEIDQSLSRGKISKTRVTLPLSGFCYCADCGNKMRQQGIPSAYLCGLYSRAGKNYCGTHYIRTATLENIILEDIRSMLDITVDEDEARRIFLERKVGDIEQQTANDNKKIKEYESRLAELEKLIRSVYEDKVMGRVAEEMCLSLLDGYQKEKEKLSSELSAIQNRINTQLQDSKDVDEFISRLKKYAGAEKLTREMCLELIEYVIVDENLGRGKSRDIHIYYKFIDERLNNPNNALD